MEKKKFEEKIDSRERELKEKYYKDFFGDNPALKQYHEKYYYNVPDKFIEITETQIITSMSSSVIAILGDIHYSTLAKKSMRKYLLKMIEHISKIYQQTLLEIGKNIIIALEIFDEKGIVHLKDYISKKISYNQFCKNAVSLKNWGIGFADYYKPLFNLMADYEMNCVPLFVDPRRAKNNLEARDNLMASMIINHHLENRNKHLVAIVGDWHSASNHLQNKIIKIIDQSENSHLKKIKNKISSYYLNHDRIWEWKKEKGKVDTQYFKIEKNVFAIADTRPDVKFFSIYDKNKIGENLDPDDLMDEGLYDYLFHNIVKDLSDILGINIETTIINWNEKVEIFTPSTKEVFFERLKEKKKESGFITDQKLKEVTVQVIKYRSCFIPVSPNSNWIFISSTCTPNQYAQMATRYIRDNFIDKKKAVGPVDKFYIKIIDEGLRFVGNKLINSFVECNEKSKAERIIRDLSIKKRLKYSEKIELYTARMIIEHLMAERKGFDIEFVKAFKLKFFYSPVRKNLKAINYEIYLGVIRALGRILGDKIFNSLSTFKHEEQIRRIKEILFTDYGTNTLAHYINLKNIHGKH